VLAFLQTSDTEVCAAVLNIRIPGGDGIETLRDIRGVDTSLPVVLISSSSSTPDVVNAMKEGATDFLSKPFTQQDLCRVLSKAIESCPAVSRPQARNVSTQGGFTGSDPRVKEIQARAGQIGRSGAPVLIQGETGCGKEVLARDLHAQSARSHKPFLKLNCAALPSELVESELFGYERGAFTGAFQKKAGMFELADGGTILLDEIGDMDVRLQAKLLQVLQDQEFRRVGGKETVKVDVRIMAATHRDLEKAIAEGTFREDLYYRLSVIVVQLPSLRDRPSDIIPLAEFLIRKYVTPGSPNPVISVDLKHAMLTYKWPGNVRELENYMRKLVIFQDPDTIARDLQTRMNRKTPMAVRTGENQVVDIGRGEGMSVLQQVTKVKQKAETDAILAVLDSTRWNRKQAASILKIDYKSLLYKMKKLGIDDSPVSISEQSSSPLLHNARAANGN
jgi:two-component system response regulator AtoC